MKVLFILNIPSPYRLRFFEELGKKCDLTVLFERSGSAERDNSWLRVNFKNFKGTILEGIHVNNDLAFTPSAVKYFKEQYDFVFVADFLSPTGMLVTRYLRLHKIPYILESDGGFASPVNTIKKLIKTASIKGAQAYFSTGAAHDEYYAEYGAEPDKLFRYPFSSIKEDEILKKAVTDDDKSEIRKKFGIKESKIILYVGQFIHRKGIDVLLKAYAKCQNENTGLYLIGGSATEEYQAIEAEHHLKNVHYIEFQKPEVIAEYYKAADVFVLPTRYDIWGLVVNEALAYGLPVITTYNCLAGLELVKEKYTGLLFESENADELSDCIQQVLNYDANEYTDNCLKIAHQYTIETMVSRHIEYMEANIHH